MAGLLWVESAPGATNTPPGYANPDDDYIVDVWDSDRGLPQSTVTSIAQTPDGYLWIGTLLGGLARFDGERFVTFHPGNTPELPSIEIHQLLVDPHGTLWIGVVEGAIISRRNGQFRIEDEDTHTPYSWLNGLVASRTNEVILSSTYGWLFYGHRQGGTNRWKTLKPPGAFLGSMPCMDRNGVIWYRQKNSHLAQIHGKTVKSLPTLPGLATSEVSALAKDSEGHIWVGTSKELARWNGEKFVNMMPTNAPFSINVLQIAAARDGGLWIWTGHKILKWMNQKWVTVADLSDFNLPASQRPLELHPDANGGVWLMKWGAGLWHVDQSGLMAKIGAAQGLPSNLLECWFQDREGNVWVGLSGGGLACIHKRAFHVVWPQDTTIAQSAVSVCEDASSNMWFGTSGGSVLRWANGKFTKWSAPPANIEGVDSTVCPDAQGRIWVGTIQNGVWLFESNSLRRPFPSQEVGTVARVLYQDHAGRMWIGNEFGLFCWENHRLKKFTAKDGFSSAYILAIMEDDAGTLWLGTAVGELRSYKDGKFTSYRPTDALGTHRAVTAGNAKNPESVGRGTLSGGERFWTIYADHEGVLWIGTLGGGLLRFKDGHFTRYTTRDGLPNDHVSQILEDRRGRFWLGTRAGIARVERESLEMFARGEIKSVPFITYGKFDGLPSIECSGGYQPDCWAGTDGRLWFTTVKGAAWINPKKLPFNPIPPPVRIEEVWVDNQLVYESNPGPQQRQESSDKALQPRQQTKTPLQITAGRHYFEFKFTALSFVSPDKVQFKWRLQGLEKNWVNGGTSRSVSYSYLPPGHYNFMVKACNNDGVWNEEGAHLQFSVRPFFWQTWWFKALMVFAAGALLFVIYSIRIARLRGLEHLRLRIARDLHDDVGANLGSISLLAQVMEKHPSTEDAVQIRSIVGQTVDTLRDIVWFIDPKHERLSDLITRMEETAKNMLVSIPYKFEQEGEFGSTSLPLNFRRNMMPIFKETLHNALKHAQATSIKITVGRTNNHFHFQVQDNGRGFDPTHFSSGNGLKNIRRRASEMNAVLEIKSNHQQGTSIKLTAKIP